IRYIHMPGLPIPISPAWAAANDRVVMGLFPQMVRAGIDHLDNPGPTLLDNPDFQRGLKQMPEQYSAISYTDTRDGARFLYSLALPLSVVGVNLGLGEDIPLNAGLLPSSRTVTRHLFGNVSASVTTEEGVLSVSYGAVPVSIPAFSGSGGVAG